MKKINRLSFLLLLAPLLCGCGSKSKYTLSCYAYGTMWSVELYEGGQEDIDYIESLLLETSKVFDDEQSHFDEGDLYALNNATTPIKIDQRLYDLLQSSLDIQTQCQGLFNVLSRDLADLYKSVIESENPTLPSQESINAEVTKISNSHIELYDDGKALIVGDAHIDLGAIGKGYALDLIASYLDEKKITRFMVNGGNSSILLGKTQQNKSYTLYMEDDASFSKEVSNCFIGVSSISNQHIKIGDTVISHIVNPLSGSATPRRKAALAIYPKLEGLGMTSDAYATTLMNADDELITSLTSRGDLFIHLVDYES